MAKVAITKSKMDSLANSIAAKSGVPVTMTVDEMKTAVDSILVPAGTLTVTENGVADVKAYENVDVDVFVPELVDQVSVKSTTEEQVVTAGTIIVQNADGVWSTSPIVTGITFEDKKYYVDFILDVYDGSFDYLAYVKQIVDFTDTNSVELGYIDEANNYNYPSAFSEYITSVTLNKNGNLSYTYTGWNEDLGMGCYINVVKILDGGYATVKVEPMRLRYVSTTPTENTQYLRPGLSEDLKRTVGTYEYNNTTSNSKLGMFRIPVTNIVRTDEFGNGVTYHLSGTIQVSKGTSTILMTIDCNFAIHSDGTYTTIPYTITTYVDNDNQNWPTDRTLKATYGVLSGIEYITLDYDNFIIAYNSTAAVSLTVTEYYPYDGLSSVIVNPIPSQYIIPTGSITISNNGTVDVTNYASAIVNISVDAVADAVTTLANGATAHNITGLDLSQDTVDAAHLLYGYTAHDRSGNAITGTYQSTGLTQSKIIIPSESQQTVTPDSGYDALSSVVVEAIESTYVGSGITQNPTLTTSGASVIVPAGYYSTQKTKSVSTATQATPSVSINSSGLITATATQSAGYVSAGSKSGTLQLTTKSATTIIPSDQDQTAVSSGVYTTGNITVAGDNNLVAGNIKNGVSIFGVSGTYTGSGGGGSVSLQAKTNISPTESIQTITPDSGYDGLSSVQINAISSTYVGSGITSRSSTDLTASGATVTVPAGYYSSQATKSVTSGSVTAPATISGSSATVSTGTNTLTLTKTVSVTPNVTTAGYISSGTAGNASVSLTASINTRSSSDLTASGATVTVPAGYYASEASKSVTTMTLPTSASSSATSGYTSKATIGRSTSAQYINIPPGYNSAGGYYTISAVPNGTATAPSSISGTSATVSTGTNTLTLTKTVSVTPNVSTAGYISSGTAGNSSVSLTASVTTKVAATYNVSSSDQTIASGTYLTGTQTIRGVTVSGLSAGNIASGVTVKIGDSADDDRITSVTGTLAFATITTGTGNPSGGNNGDVYIKVSS